jgi:hypothetical protein
MQGSMTLVAGFVSGSRPFIVGDLLISGPEREKDTHIPTAGSVERVFPRGSGFSIVGLKQKVAIVSDHCVIAWAGSQLGAAQVINELRARARHRRLDYESVTMARREFTAKYSALGFAAIVGIANERHVDLRHFGGETLETKAVGKVFAAGTGIGGLRNVLANPISFDRVTGNPRPLELGIAQAYLMTGSLLQAEIISARPLLHYFGGGYEVAALINGRFQKVDNTTYVFWRAQETPKGVDFAMPACLIRQHYVDDLLVIRVANSEFRPESNSWHVADEAVHAIAPVYRAFTEEDKANTVCLPFDAPRTVHCIVTYFLSGVTLVLGYHEVNPQGCSKVVRFSETKDGITFGVKDAFLRSAADRVKRIAAEIQRSR